MDLSFWAHVAEIGSFVIAAILALNTWKPKWMGKIAQWKFPLAFALLGFVILILRLNISHSKAGSWQEPPKDEVRGKYFRRANGFIGWKILC